MRLAGRRNESGMVLIAVVSFVLVISVLVLGILSRNASQAVYVENQIRRLQAEQLRKGALWVAKSFADVNQSFPENMKENLGQGKDFSIYFLKDSFDNAVNITVDY